MHLSLAWPAQSWPRSLAAFACMGSSDDGAAATSSRRARLHSKTQVGVAHDVSAHGEREVGLSNGTTDHARQDRVLRRRP